MSKTLRSFTILVLILSLCFFVLPRPDEASPSHQREAQTLSNLGLLKGGSTGFELDRQPTRAEGAVMLVRLLGQENRARSLNYHHPFIDVPVWASPYVGYMYKFGLTQGSSANAYSPNDTLSASAYTTFVLRSLGYSDQSGDFEWNDSLNKAVQIGMLTAQQANDLTNDTLTRDDMVNISYLALKIPLKNRSMTLIEKLVNEDKAVSAAAAQASGLMPAGTAAPISQASFATSSTPDSQNTFTVYNQTDMQNALKQALLNLRPSIALHFYDYSGDPFDDFEAALDRAQKSIENDTGLVNLLNKWDYQGNSVVLNVNFGYRYTWPQLIELNQKGDEIVSSLLKGTLSDYEKEKAMHDYVINHCRYDTQSREGNSMPETSFTAYGVLVKGRGVCQAYAEAVNILCRKAGLSSLMIKGTSKGTNHAWNLVKIAGEYYHLDSTWDDPISENGRDTLSYIYFNLNDQEMRKDHQWKAADYPVCRSMQYNYHVFNGQYVNDRTEFAAYVTQALTREEDRIEVRIKNFDHADYNDLEQLVTSTSDVSQYYYSIDEEQGVVSIFDLQYR